MWIKRIFAWSLVFKMTLCAVMLVLLMVYYFYASTSYGAVPRYWILELLLLPGIFVSYVIRGQVLKDRIKKWSSWLFGMESLFTLWVSYAYFSGPMHDIALDFFGHHGRFGDVIANGSSLFLIYDVKLALILFLPPLVIGMGYLWSQTFQK
jgi:hypothetical protein